MALSLGEKAQRVLKLLLGLRHPRAAGALAAYGFTEADMEEGWRLLRALGAGRLERLPLGPRDADVIRKLDEWENRWFPVVGVSLRRHYPAIHDRVFLNLSQTEGPEVAISVQTMVDRLAKLEDADGPHGPDGPKAKDLLAARGLTDAVLADARSLLASLAKVAGPVPTPASIEEERVHAAAAEAALWGWYLEWSQLARLGIKNRNLLRQLGFLSSTKQRDSGDSDDEIELDETGDDVEPVALLSTKKPNQ